MKEFIYRYKMAFAFFALSLVFSSLSAEDISATFNKALNKDTQAKETILTKYKDTEYALTLLAFDDIIGHKIDIDQHKKAEEKLLKALSVNKDFSFAQFLLGAIYWELQHATRESDYYLKASEQMMAAEKNNLFKDYGKHEDVLYMVLCESNYGTQSYKDAIAACNKAIKADSKNLENYRYKALSKLALNDAYGALAAVDESLKVDPKNEVMQAFKIRIKLDNKMDGVLDDAKIAFQKNKDNLKFKMLYAETLVRFGNKAEGCPILSEASEQTESMEPSELIQKYCGN